MGKTRGLGMLLLFVAAGAFAQQRTVPEIVRDGRQAIFDHDYVLAVESFLLALDRNPRDVGALTGLAEAYYWLSEYDQAQRYAQMAVRLSGSDADVLSLAGRISIGVGDLEAAAEFFDRALEKEPNNVAARVGEAELALAGGRSSTALQSLERALLVNPEHQKALLSIALVHEAAGRTDEAQRYIERARRVHRDQPEAHIVAAEYFLRQGAMDQALDAVTRAREISPDNTAALALETELLLRDGDDLQALGLAEQIILQNRSNASAWYLRAVAQYNLGLIDESLVSARTALTVAPDDEMIRMWAEGVAIRHLAQDAPVRRELAEHRSESASRAERGFRFDRAEQAYRRAIQLAPLNLELRVDFAELLRRMGAEARYLEQLRILVENGRVTDEITRAIEIYENALSDSVSSDWGVDQFTIRRSGATLGLYLPGGAPQSLPGSQNTILSFIERTLQSQEKVLVQTSSVTSSLSQSYSNARSAGVDYFVQVEVEAAGRLFGVRGTIYVGRTGAPTESVQSIRSGPNRVTEAVDAFVSRLVARIPQRARVLSRVGNRLLLDVGEEAGVETGDEFVVLDPERVVLAPDELAFVQGSDSRLGVAAVTRVDALVSEAVITETGIMDVISAGDLSLPKREEEEEPVANPLFPVLYERVRALQ